MVNIYDARRRWTRIVVEGPHTSMFTGAKVSFVDIAKIKQMPSKKQQEENVVSYYLLTKEEFIHDLDDQPAMKKVFESNEEKVSKIWQSEDGYIWKTKRGNFYFLEEHMRGKEIKLTNPDVFKKVIR